MEKEGYYSYIMWVLGNLEAKKCKKNFEQKVGTGDASREDMAGGRAVDGALLIDRLLFIVVC